MRQRKAQALFKILFGVVKLRTERRIKNGVRVSQNILAIDEEDHSGCG